MNDATRVAIEGLRKLKVTQLKDRTRIAWNDIVSMRPTAGLVTRPRESALIALVQEAVGEMERLRRVLEPFDRVYALVKRNPQLDYERNFMVWMYAGDDDGPYGFRATGSLHGFDVYEAGHKALNPQEDSP
jgi:hypothetical protein